MTDLLRCPVCRAELNDSPQCRRCRADLALVVAVEQQRRQLLAQATEHLRQGRPTAALTLIEQAASLRQSAEGCQLQALAQLLRRDFNGAWRAYQQMNAPTSR